MFPGREKDGRRQQLRECLVGHWDVNGLVLMSGHFMGVFIRRQS